MTFQADQTEVCEYPRAEFSNFKHRLLFDAVNLGFEHYLPNNLFGQLPQQAVWGYSTLYDEDGQLYVFIRELPPGNTNGLGLFTDRDGKDCRFAEECMSSWRGIVVLNSSDNGITWESADKAITDEPSMFISHDGNRLVWREKGILEVEGESCKPGYQWLDASPGDQAYASQLHRVSGTILGKPVKGWVGLDVLYLAPGNVYAYSPMAKGLVLNWSAFANEYDDGSWELGLIMKGFSNFCCALIIDDQGKITRSSHVQPEYTVDDDGFPTRMRFAFRDELTGEDQSWLWTPHPRGNLVDIPVMMPANPYYRGVAATVSRDNETREIVSSFGWPDFYGDERVGLYEGIGE